VNVGLLIFTSYSQIVEKFVKLPPVFTSQGLITIWFQSWPWQKILLCINTREQKGFTKIQKFVRFPELNFLFRTLSSR